jgi:hypothetical protein
MQNSNGLRLMSLLSALAVQSDSRPLLATTRRIDLRPSLAAVAEVGAIAKWAP